MAYFAELDENNIVTNVLEVGDSDSPDEATGITFLQNIFGSDTKWKQCMQGSDPDNETVLRKQHPPIGSQYNEDNDIFILQQKWASWTLDENFDWQPPVPMPEWTWDNWYQWDEDNLQWVARQYADDLEPSGTFGNNEVT